MQEKKRIPLKRLHRLRNARKQAAETDDLTPMMKAIKAVHSVTSTGSTQPEDLERQRAAQELFGRLVTPNLLINTTPITVNNVSAEWVRMNQGHDRRHVVLYCHGGGYTCGNLDYAKGFAATLADECGVRVFCAAYRLAPENRYPAALDDAVESYSHSRKGDAEYETCMEEISDRNRNDRCTRTVSRMWQCCGGYEQQSE